MVLTSHPIRYLLWGREPPAIEVSKPLSQNITSSNQIKRTSRNSTAAMIDGEAMKSLPQENKKTVKKPNAEPSKKKKVRSLVFSYDRGTASSHPLDVLICAYHCDDYHGVL
jgi:hypothetical protein